MIRQWAAEAPQPVLAALGARREPRTDRWQAPSEDTFGRLARVDAAAVDLDAMHAQRETARYLVEDKGAGRNIGSAVTSYSEASWKVAGRGRSRSAQVSSP
jgi:hypothetical protein